MKKHHCNVCHSRTTRYTVRACDSCGQAIILDHELRSITHIQPECQAYMEILAEAVDAGKATMLSVDGTWGKVGKA